MTIKELLKEQPNPVGELLWVTFYSFKGGSSNFIHKHVKPSLVEVTSAGEQYENWAQISFTYISKKTFKHLSKSDRLYNEGKVFRTEEECIEHYKERLQDHIDNKISTIADIQTSIDKLNEKIEEN